MKVLEGFLGDLKTNFKVDLKKSKETEFISTQI